MSELISEKANKNLNRNEEVRRRNSKYIVLVNDESIVLKFDPEKIDIKQSEFEGKRSLQFVYAVIEPSDSTFMRYFSANTRTSKAIDRCLNEGHILLKIQRRGIGIHTQYLVSPT
jgi:hypothetical protein